MVLFLQIYSDENMRKAILRWVIMQDQPFSVVESIEFKNMMRLARSDIKLISRDSLRADIVELWTRSRQIIRRSLMDSPGKISFATDGWSAINMDSYLGVTAHWIDKNWDLKDIIADFVPLEGPHSAENLYHAFKIAVQDLGSLSKVFIVNAL